MILSYSLISSLLLACGYITFRLTMSGQCQHAFNRMAILTVYGISLIAPLIILAVMLHHQEQAAGLQIEISDPIWTSEEGNDIGKTWTISLSTLINAIVKLYLVGVAICAIYFTFGILMLGRIIKKGVRTTFGTFSLIIIDNNSSISPHSWGRSIVMTRRDYEEYGDLILLHEHAHRRLFHWADLILAYATICLQWYNPASWAMRKEIRDIHEYQADESVLKAGTDAKEYQMLLLNKATGNGFLSLANNLNHSKLKKRIAMMYEKKTSLKGRLVALTLIPAIGVGIVLTAIPSVARVLESIAASSETHTETPQMVTTDRVVYVALENEAEFPGGMEALMKWLYDNLVYPEEAEKAGIQGRVIVKFIIEADGTVTNPEIVKGISPEVDAEVLRLISSMPKWNPGKVNGKEVASYFTLPVVFHLKDK